MGAQVTHGSADAWNNNVIVKNCTITFLMGAKVNSGKGNAENNTVEIYSGNIVNAYGGVSNSEGNADLNKIYMKGGTVTSVNGGYTANGDATGNTVNITGGSITGNVAGGNINTSSNCKATGNTISISGSPDLSGATLYGGYGTGTGSDIRTGNTLDIKASGLSAQNVKNFDTMNFTVSSDVKPGDTILTLNGAEKTDISDVTINVTVAPRTQPLNKGDQVCLLRNSKGIEGNFIEGELTVQQGFSANYTLALTTGTSLDFEVVDAFASPGSKSFLEGRTAMLAFVNQGAELIAERGMEAARQEALEGSLTPFLAGQGGKSRYDTGSHVDVTGFSLIAGLTSAKKTEIGTATMAAFFESGWGDYDAHNSFASAASVNADGNTRYYGGGLLAHMAFPDFGPGHAYAEASLRTGWAETDYHSGDLSDSFGNTAAYDSGSAYYGAHFGLGCEWQLSDVSALDFYAKYFWTHQEGDHVRVMNDPIRFESADSHRSRFGVRYEHEFKTDGMVVTPFLGAAYEYEYDGDVAGTAYGFAMDKPSLRGGTGAGELGVTLKSSESSAVSLNLSMQGYTGTREGVSGSFLLNYRF